MIATALFHAFSINFPVLVLFLDKIKYLNLLIDKLLVSKDRNKTNKLTSMNSCIRPLK